MQNNLFAPAWVATLATFLFSTQVLAVAAPENVSWDKPFTAEATFLSASVEQESDGIIVSAEGRLPSRCWQYNGTRIEVDHDSNVVRLFPYKKLTDEWCPPGLTSFEDRFRLRLEPGLWMLKFAGFANTKLVTQ